MRKELPLPPERRTTFYYTVVERSAWFLGVEDIHKTDF